MVAAMESAERVSCARSEANSGPRKPRATSWIVMASACVAPPDLESMVVSHTGMIAPRAEPAVTIQLQIDSSLRIVAVALCSAIVAAQGSRLSAQRLELGLTVPIAILATQ